MSRFFHRFFLYCVFFASIVSGFYQKSFRSHGKYHQNSVTRPNRSRRWLSKVPPPGKVANPDQWIQWSSNSLEKATGKSLYERLCVASPREVHSNDKYCVLSHGTQADPIYCYFNRAALDLFQWSEDKVYHLPSRYSAPEGKVRQERQQVLQQPQITEALHIDTAVRQNSHGQLFTIHDLIYYNVYNDQGDLVGQTAVFDRRQVVLSEEGCDNRSQGTGVP